MDNVEKILTRYKNQMTSSKKFNVDMHIEVLNLIMLAQKDNLEIKIEVTMMII